MTEEIKPCRKCGTMPKIYSVQGMWYSYCPHCCANDQSGKESIYKNLTLSERKAIALWNELNSKEMSQAQKDAIARQKERYAKLRAEKAAQEAAQSIIKRRPETIDDKPRIIGIDKLTAKRL